MLVRFWMAGIAGLVLVAASGRAAEPKTLRVLTYNIHHGEGTDGKIDLPRQARVIREAKPDLVALQEVDRKTRRSGGVDQTAELARLTGLHGKFGKQLEYDGGEYGQAILSRFPLVRELTVHWLPGTPNRERRIAAAGRVRFADRDLTFVSTHLHHQNATFREQQARQLNELFARSDDLMILAGDLNATPNEKPIGLLGEKWSVSPAREHRSYPAARPLKLLDYILVRPADRWRIVESTVIAESIASDHRPVLSILEWIEK